MYNNVQNGFFIVAQGRFSHLDITDLVFSKPVEYVLELGRLKQLFITIKQLIITRAGLSESWLTLTQY